MGHVVFVSYSSQDKAAADGVVQYLEAQGIKCWIAPRDILPGADYIRSIMQAIKDCALAVFVLSSHSLQSRHTDQEMDFTFNKDKVRIPYRIQNVNPLEDTWYWYFSKSQWIDAFPPNDEKVALETLAIAIRHHTGTHATPPAPLPPTTTHTATEVSDSFEGTLKAWVEELNNSFSIRLAELDTSFYYNTDNWGPKIGFEVIVGGLRNWCELYMNSERMMLTVHEGHTPGAKDLFIALVDKFMAQDFPERVVNKKNRWSYLKLLERQFDPPISCAGQDNRWQAVKQDGSHAFGIILSVLSDEGRELSRILCELADKLIFSLREVFPSEEGWEFTTPERLLAKWAYISVHKRQWQWQEDGETKCLELCMSSEGELFDNFIIGIRKTDPSILVPSEAHGQIQTLMEQSFGKGKTSPWFPYWRWADKQFRFTGGSQISVDQVLGDRQNDFVSYYVDQFQKMKDATGPMEAAFEMIRSTGGRGGENSV